MSYSIVNPNKLPNRDWGMSTDKEIYDSAVRIFTGGFGRVFSSIIPDLKPKTKIVKKGKLCSSRLYRYQYDARLFTKSDDNHKDFDLTFVFLLDISGSMSARAKVHGGFLSRLDASKAVMKSLIRASKKQLSDRIKIEVLTKSCPETSINDFGNPIFLSRIFSTEARHIDEQVIDDIGYSCPIKEGDSERGVSSSTPELLAGKGVIDFIRNNVTTKNVIVFNLTDGEAWCGASLEYEGWRGCWGIEENRIAIKKYFSKIPFVSILIGYGDEISDEIKETYPNPVMCSDYNFPKKLENVVKKVVKSIIE